MEDNSQAFCLGRPIRGRRLKGKYDQTMTKAPAALPLSVLERLRADTPATGHRVHLDNAGASLMPAPVVDAIQRTVALEACVGGYVAHEAWRINWNEVTALWPA